VCIYIYIYICIYSHSYLTIYKIYIYMCVCVCMYEYIYIYNTYIYAYICICTHIYVYIYIYIYIFTCIHVYTYIQTVSQNPKRALLPLSKEQSHVFKSILHFQNNTNGPTYWLPRLLLLSLLAFSLTPSFSTIASLEVSIHTKSHQC